jgi:hypothetical protein
LAPRGRASISGKRSRNGSIRHSDAAFGRDIINPDSLIARKQQLEPPWNEIPLYMTRSAQFPLALRSITVHKEISMNSTARLSTAVITSFSHWIRGSAHHSRQAFLTIATMALLGNAGVVHAQWTPNGDLLTTSDVVGIGTTAPAATLDVVGGLLHVAGTTTPKTTTQGAYLGWNALTGGTGETDFINNQGGGSGGFAFMNTPVSGSPRQPLMVITGSGDVGIGTTAPAATLDIAAGTLHVDQPANPTEITTPVQGAYIAWNALNGSTGETDFINNLGGGGGGFAFMNTPPSGSPRTTLMIVAGDGTVTIPAGRLLVADGSGKVMDVVAAINYILGQIPN